VRADGKTAAEFTRRAKPEYREIIAISRPVHLDGRF